MSKYLYIIFLLLAAFQYAGAQGLVEKEKELINNFNKATTDTAKFEAGLFLFQFYRNEDSSKAMQWYRTSRTFSGDKRSEARLQNALGSFLLVYGKMDTAIVVLNKALIISKETGPDKVQAAIYNNLGVYYLQLSRYKDAIANQLKGLKIREDLQDDEGIEASLVNIGNIYQRIYSVDTAISYYKRALDYAFKLKLTSEIAKIYSNMGATYADKDEYTEAYNVLLRSLEYRKLTNDLTGTCLTLTSLGDVCTFLKRFPEASGYFDQAYKLSEQLGDGMNMANILNSLGHMEQERKNYDKSIEYQLKALRLSRSIPYMDVEKDALIELVENYERSGRPKQALEYYKLFIAAKDSVTDAGNQAEIAELHTKYETEKKVQQISLLNKENTIQKLSIAKRNTTIFIIAALLMTVALLAFLFYKSNRLKQAASLQKEIMHQRDLAAVAVLEAEENERKRIAADLHDGVGQMFSTVRMNLSGIMERLTFTESETEASFAKTLLLVDESCKEVRNISHQMAPNMLITYGLVSAVRDFLGKIDERKLNVALEVEGLNDRLNTNTEIVLYRVIQETVNNVIKHAAATSLDLQLVKDATGLSIMIEDNGKGFTYSPSTEGMGLKNMLSRITFLNGTVDIDSAEGRGTVISLWIPSL